MDIVSSFRKYHKASIHVWRTLLPIILSVNLFLLSCQDGSLLPDDTITNTAVVAVERVTTATPSTTPEPTVTSTTTPIPVFLVDSQCPITSAFTESLAKGAISYWGRNKTFGVLLNLENGEKNLLPDFNGPRIIVSPDRDKIAYSDHDPNTLIPFLVVYVLDTQQRIELQWPGDRHDLSGWLDNEHILFTNFSSDPPYSHLVLNPFTKEEVVISPDYPDISPNDMDWNNSGSVVYDQSLDYVVYATWEEESNEHKYVLWNISSQNKLAVLPGNSYGGYTVAYAEIISVDGVTYNPPAWSTDDTRVAVISSSPVNSKVDEIFTINKNGDVQQLTEFSSQFDEVNIRTLSWSPNGEEIAFFITTEPGPFRTPRNERLAVLDTKTRQVTLYCIEGDVDGTRAGMFIGDEEQTPAPLWSPDGTQLILENRYEANASRLILLDILNNTAYEVGQNMQPFGWMLSEP